MEKEKISQIAKKLCQAPKGILAADESTNTIKKRLDSIKVASNFESRRDYRELLFKAKGIKDYISGVILYDETIKQEGSDGIPFTKFLSNNNIIPGIKVDKGALPLSSGSDEKITEGLDGLSNRLTEYKSLGAKFTKWRAIIEINNEKKIPSDYCIHSNVFMLARYARIVQDNGMVPIVEPEVLMDGDHSINDCFEVTGKTLKLLFNQLSSHGVFLGGMLLKPNMVISGKKCSSQASIQEVAKMTLSCLEENVSQEVPGIVFLSGGQSNELATKHLNEMNKLKKKIPWKLSFSYGRALQQPSLSLWQGKKENVKNAQDALYLRSKLNSNATLGNYSSNDEKQMPC